VAGAGMSVKVGQFGVLDQDGYVVTVSAAEATSQLPMLQVASGIEGSAFLAGVADSGTLLTTWFDRSPFFYTPSEIDPNTQRDISEIEPFLVYSTASIYSYSIFTNTVGSSTIITDKGEDWSPEALSPVNVIGNGDFEQNFSGWTLVESGTDQITVVRSQPAGAGSLTPGCCPPPQGGKMVWADMSGAESGSYLVSEAFFSPSLSSDDIRSFSAEVASGNTGGVRFICFALQFFETEGDPVYEIRLRVNNLGCDADDSAYDALNFSPDKTIVFSDIVSDTFTTLTSQLDNELSGESFSFGHVKLFVIFGGISGWDNDFLLDDIQLTFSVLPEHLRSTRGSAHINTAHPVGSGYGLDPSFGDNTFSVPLTISGSDDINQIDLTPPYFDETSPLSGTRNVPEYSDLGFHVKDAGSSLDTSTINVYVDGLQIVNAATTVTGTTWPVAFKTVLASNDIEYLFRRGSDFTPGSVVTVSGEFGDSSPAHNYTESEYQFNVVGSGGLPATISGAADADPPGITPTEPVDAATQVSPNTEVRWSLTDNAAGVDPSTVKLWLNGALVLENDLAAVGSFSRVANASRGYDYNYVPAIPFTYGTTVTGTIEAADSVGNSDNLTYEFTVTPAETLEIQNFFLSLNESTPLTTGTLMSVEVVDFTHGVASGTTTFTVNGAEPAGLLTTYSGSGPDRVIFAVPLEPLVDFREDLVVLVHAENQFPGTFPVVKEEQYTLRPGYGVEWPNKEAGGPETVFPHVTNIEVLADVGNFALNCGAGSTYFRFTTESQGIKDLGAILISSIDTADLAAELVVLNPFFEYGKTMVLEIEADDLAGNQFRLTHTFVIEQRP
jgi:hypothetical protein